MNPAASHEAVAGARLPLRLSFSVSGCCYAPQKSSGTAKVDLALRCAPPSGSVPDPVTACRRIAEHVGRFLGPTPNQQCIGGPPPWDMTITGVYRGTRIHRVYPNSTCPSRANRSQMQAWASLLRASPFVRVIVASDFHATPFPPRGIPHLTITVRRPHAATRVYSLGCAPPEGTHPDPAGACRALADYLRRPKRYVRCLGMYLGPIVSVTGRYDDRPFRLSFGWLCGRPRPVASDLRAIGAYSRSEG